MSKPKNGKGICMTLNERIGQLRNHLGLSQRAFGEQVRRSVGYISKVESGQLQPSEEVVEAICSAFGVDERWLKEGEGFLETESVGDRVKRARKARHYTQEELAAELGVSRNTVGMIERRTVRPGDKVIRMLCDKLWIDRAWLLTGTGHMDRTELTPFYELLRRDPRIRRHIKAYINHLDNRAAQIRRKKQGRVGTDGLRR